MKATSLAVLGSAIFVATCARLEAAFSSGLISVDFDFQNGPPTTQVGAALIGASGDAWNSVASISAQTTGTLILSNGSVSDGVTLSLDAATSSTIVLAGGPFASTPYSALMNDGHVATPGNRLTLNGLTPFQPYDIYLYSDVSGSDNRTTAFTINGDTQFVINSGSLSTFALDNNYAYFAAKPADAGGQLVITIDGVPVVSQPPPFLNGFQITPVPEPSCLALLALGGLILTYSCRCGRVRTT